MERKTELLKQLQVISPSYYGHLKSATTTVDLLTEATNRYTASIKAQARQLAIQEAQEDQLKAIASRQREVLEFERKRNKLIAEYDENLDGIIGLQEQINMGGFKAEDLRLLNQQIRVGEQDIERMTNELIDFENQFGNVGLSVNDLSRDLDSYGNVIADASEDNDNFSSSVSRMPPHLNEAAHAITDFSERTQTARMTMGQFFSMLENVQVQAEATKQQFIDMGEEIKHALVGIAMSFDGTGGFMFKGLKALGDMLVSIGQKMIVTAEAFKQFRKFLIKNPALAVAAGIAFVVAGNALTNLATRQMEVPALAQGGVAYGPTMAMIGDNRNAAIDPEVVAPLSKLRDMMGGNQVEVFGRIQGNDIFLSNARTGTSRNRYA
jgi:hypothetical protein